jgi:CBS-domain-containing membrane protein
MLSFSAMRLFLALRLTSVRLMAQVTMPLATMMMVAARTIHPPQATCGTKSKMSTRKASSETRSVGKVKMSRAWR